MSTGAVKILEKYGRTVEIAENGSLAVDSFKARVAQGKPFDFILVSRLPCIVFELFRPKTFAYRCPSWVVWKPRNSLVRMRCIEV